MTEHAFYEVASILGIAAVLGTIGMLLRQPLIVAFLAAGILAGPSGFSLLQSYGQIELLAHIGISLLLFVVGLKLDIGLIRTTGPVALATGLGQVIFTSVFGFVILLILKFSVVNSLYIAVALTFSSTIIIVKLLSDKKEIDALHGRIAVGFLIVQDIVAILAMIMLTAWGGGTGGDAAVSKISFILFKGIGFLVVIGLLMKFVLPGVTKRVAWSQELLILFAIAWAVFLGAAGDYLGFSKEVGAFLGGVSLASTQYRDAIAARLVGLRDFLLLFFFIDLGARLDFKLVVPQIPNAIWLSLFVLIGNPLIVMGIMGIMGYRRRTGFLAGLAVAQISEFSLILIALGLNLGQVNMEAVGLVTLVGVITICISTYMIIYSSHLYRWLQNPMRIFERKKPYREQIGTEEFPFSNIDFVLIGLGNYGSGLAFHLLRRGKRIAAADFNPQVLAGWQSRNVPVIFGDVGDPEFLDNLPLNFTSWVVSTVRDRGLNTTLVNLLHQRHYTGKIALTAVNEEEADFYSKSGAHVVLRPFDDASEEAADSLTEAMHLLPQYIDWPLAMKEIRLRKDAIIAGKLIGNLDLRAVTGITILAVSRAGRVYLHPDPEFQLFPGDRLVLMGEPTTLKDAEEILDEAGELPEEGQEPFATADVEVGPSSPNINRSLAEIEFRSTFGATVVGIIRGQERIPMPRADERLKVHDKVIVIGTRQSIDNIKTGGI